MLDRIAIRRPAAARPLPSAAAVTGLAILTCLSLSGSASAQGVAPSVQATPDGQGRVVVTISVAEGSELWTVTINSREFRKYC